MPLSDNRIVQLAESAADVLTTICPSLHPDDAQSAAGLSTVLWARRAPDDATWSYLLQGAVWAALATLRDDGLLGEWFAIPGGESLDKTPETEPPDLPHLWDHPGLSDESRTLLMLRFRDGLSWRDVGDSAGIAASTAQRRSQNVLAWMRKTKWVKEA